MWTCGQVGGCESSGSGFPGFMQRCRATEHGAFHRLQDREPLTKQMPLTGPPHWVLGLLSPYCSKLLLFQKDGGYWALRNQSKKKKEKEIRNQVKPSHNEQRSTQSCIPPPDARDQLWLPAPETSFRGLENLNSCRRLDGVPLNKTKADYISQPTAESSCSLIKSAQTFHQRGAHTGWRKSSSYKRCLLPTFPSCWDLFKRITPSVLDQVIEFKNLA